MSLTFGQAIADALVTQIAAATWAVALEPKRRYAARWLKLSDADAGQIHVDVCQGEEQTELHTRSQKKETVEIEIAIRKRFGTADQDQHGETTLEAIDAVAAIQDAIRVWLNTTVAHWAIDVSATTGLTAAVGQMTGKIKSTYIPAHLLTLNQYTGILTVEFQGVLSC